MDKISIVVPCYCEEKSLPLLYSELKRISRKMDNVIFEYIFIDDCSLDSTLEVIKTFAQIDNNVKYVSLSRNFGKEAAMYAGLQHSTGDYCAIMDADLQDPPNLIIEMYSIVKDEGFDCAATRRVSRKGEPFLRSFMARQFYKFIRKISDIKIVDGARDFRLMSRNMVNAVLSMNEVNRFSKGIFSWVGFNTKWIEFENVKRIRGESKWSFWSLFLYSIEGITAFSTAPLAISSVTGIVFFILSIIAIVITVVRQMLWGGSAYGWSSLVCIVLMVSGIQLFCIGILGQYLSKTYLESKKRPIYITRESNVKSGFVN